MKLEAKIDRLLELRRQVSELETEIAADLHLNGFTAAVHGNSHGVSAAPTPAPVPAMIAEHKRKRTKVTEQMDSEIRALKKRGESISAIAETVGVPKSTVGYVLYASKRRGAASHS